MLWNQVTWTVGKKWIIKSPVHAGYINNKASVTAAILRPKTVSASYKHHTNCTTYHILVNLQKSFTLQASNLHNWPSILHLFLLVLLLKLEAFLHAYQHLFLCFSETLIGNHPFLQLNLHHSLAFLYHFLCYIFPVPT